MEMILRSGIGMFHNPHLHPVAIASWRLTGLPSNLVLVGMREGKNQKRNIKMVINLPGSGICFGRIGF